MIFSHTHLACFTKYMHSLSIYSLNRFMFQILLLSSNPNHLDKIDHDKWLGAKAINTASMLSICIFGDPVTWSGSRPGGLGCECPGW